MSTFNVPVTTSGHMCTCFAFPGDDPVSLARLRSIPGLTLA